MTDNPKRILLVGNPNVGKSVIFGWLTGRYVTVSNYPGTTVEIARGQAHIGGASFEVIDTPGINSLLPQSEDERITRDILMEEPSLVVQVADAKNIERALHITYGLIEMETPFILVLNMADEAKDRGISINAKKLEEKLGIPVVETVATERLGLDNVKTLLKKAAKSHVSPRYMRGDFESGLSKICTLPEGVKLNRAAAIMALGGDRSFLEWLEKRLPSSSLKEIENIYRETASGYSRPVSALIYEDRGRFIRGVADDVIDQAAKKRRAVRERFVATMIHPFFGLFWAAAVLALMYIVVGKFAAGFAVDWMQNSLFGAYVSPAAIYLADKFLSFSPLIRDCLVGQYGLITMGLTYAVAIVMPIVAAFFFVFGILEDVGYLPRLAVMLNKTFKRLGLQGKAVLPMVLGFGCGTMATLVTRILETKKERIIATLLLALGIPCSAQLGVILGLFGELPVWAPIVWGATVLATMLVVGRLASIIIKGRRADFIMEVPPLRIPVIRNLVWKTASRVWWYLREAVPLFLLGTFVLFTLDRLQWLTGIEKGMKPLVGNVLGLPQEAASAFLIGFLRRDYGATRFFDLFHQGMLNSAQAVTAMVVITLFVPCIASVFVIIKERGWKTALAVFATVFPIAFIVGGLLRFVLQIFFPSPL